MEIQRHNIFELIGGRQNLYHSAILTSYAFDPIFFESFFLPRLRQCGISNVVVLLDASNYDQVLLQYPSFSIQSDRRQYSLIRQMPTNNGVFHPKISMFFGEDAGLIVVGSGNLTYNGHGLNEEVWNVFSLKGTESVYLPLFIATWQYLNGLNLPDAMLLKQQLRWVRENTNWLSDDVSTNSGNVTIGNEQYLFLSNDSKGTILSKLQEMIGDEIVESIVTISPFYDTSGITVRTLHDIFNPKEVKCVYSEGGIYPYDMMKNPPKWLKLYSWDDVFTTKRSDVHKLHAKIIQFALQSRTILISGSANVTKAAFNGAGDEAGIAIISENTKDYIKGLGVNLDNRTIVNPSILETLTKPERASSETTARSIHIVSAEIVDDALSVILSKSSIENSRLRILDFVGNLLQDIDVSIGEKRLLIKEFSYTNCIAVIIDESNTEISNRSFIISEEDVARFNPNKALRKLDSLLESNKDWKDNLTGILSYLWFDNSSDIKNISTKTFTVHTKKDVAGKSVSKEDFDNIRIGSRQTILSLPDVRIIDFLLSSEKKPKEADVSDNSDDVDALQDVDGGNNEYHNSEHVIDRQKHDKAFVDCIDNYSRRLRKHYDVRLAELYSKAANFGADIFKKEFNETAIHVNVMDFSRILIDIVLMWQELSKDFNSRHGNIRQDFIRNLGKFLILSRKGYPQTDDYAWHKCVEFHKELIVFSLLIITSQDWRGSEVMSIKLLIANLLSACANSVLDTNEIKDLFGNKVMRSNVPIKASSMALIKKTIEEYQEFRRHFEDKSTVREVDFDNPNGNYSYRTGYGFFYVTDLNFIRQPDRIVPEMTLYHPGFDDTLKVLGGRKILPLC